MKNLSSSSSTKTSVPSDPDAKDPEGIFPSIPLFLYLSLSLSLFSFYLFLYLNLYVSFPLIYVHTFMYVYCTRCRGEVPFFVGLSEKTPNHDDASIVFSTICDTIPAEGQRAIFRPSREFYRSTCGVSMLLSRLGTCDVRVFVLVSVY